MSARRPQSFKPQLFRSAQDLDLGSTHPVYSILSREGQTSTAYKRVLGGGHSRAARLALNTSPVDRVGMP